MLMKPILNRISALGRGQSGQTIIEYALILSFFSVAMVLSLEAFQGGLDGLYDTIIAGWP